MTAVGGSDSRNLCRRFRTLDLNKREADGLAARPAELSAPHVEGVFAELVIAAECSYAVHWIPAWRFVDAITRAVPVVWIYSRIYYAPSVRGARGFM